jgi:hypothetical protein
MNFDLAVPELSHAYRQTERGILIGAKAEGPLDANREMLRVPSPQIAV